MSVNKMADRLFQSSLALLLVFVALRNTWGLFGVSIITAIVSAVFAIRYRKDLSKSGLFIILILILTSTALAVIAWKA